MKTECPFCRKRFKVPEAYSGRPAKCCFCKQAFVVAPYQPPPIVETEAVKEAACQLAKSGNNLFVSAWKRTPLSFKTGFLMTLGGLSAILLALHVYPHIPFQADQQSNLFHYQRILEQNLLFSDGKPAESAVFRGRRLNRLVFSPDANRPVPKLELWMTDKEDVVGFSAVWYADAFGWPADIDDSMFSKSIYLTQYNANNQVTKRTLKCFENFTAIKTIIVEKLKFEPGINNQEVAYYEKKPWLFVFSRSQTSLKNKPEFVAANKKVTPLPIDEKVWLFTVTAQTW